MILWKPLADMTPEDDHDLGAHDKRRQPARCARCRHELDALGLAEALDLTYSALERKADR